MDELKSKLPKLRQKADRWQVVRPASTSPTRLRPSSSELSHYQYFEHQQRRYYNPCCPNNRDFDYLMTKKSPVGYFKTSQNRKQQQKKYYQQRSRASSVSSAARIFYVGRHRRERPPRGIVERRRRWYESPSPVRYNSSNSGASEQRRANMRRAAVMMDDSTTDGEDDGRLTNGRKYFCDSTDDESSSSGKVSDTTNWSRARSLVSPLMSVYAAIYTCILIVNILDQRP